MMIDKNRKGRIFNTDGIVVSSLDFEIGLPYHTKTVPLIIRLNDDYLDINGEKIAYEELNAVLQKNESLFGNKYRLIIYNDYKSYSFPVPGSEINQGLPFNYSEDNITLKGINNLYFNKWARISLILLILSFIINFIGLFIT